MEFEIALITACAALVGSLAGGLTTYFITRQQHRHELKAANIAKRESIYSDFVAEVARLLTLTADSRQWSITEFAQASALSAQIRMFASPGLGKIAEEIFAQTVRAAGNKGVVSMGMQIAEARIRFTDAARAELEALRNS